MTCATARRGPLQRGLRSCTLLAGAALLAHLLMAAHSVAHVSDPSLEVALQYCAVCSIGQHAAGVPAPVPAMGQPIAGGATESADSPSSPTRDPDRATFARAPPSPPALALARIG